MSAVKGSTGCLWLLFTLLSGLVLYPIASAFVGVHVWMWFIAPHVHEQITMPEFYGLSSFFNLLRGPSTANISEKDEKKMAEHPWLFLGSKLVGVWLGAGLLLMACYLVHRWFT